MKKQTIDEMAHIFGNIFVLSNKLQTLVDRELAPYDLTAKQWFLLACLENYFPENQSETPNLKRLANVMGSSYQNVKQIALKLEQSGFVTIEKDPQDMRALMIKPTEKNKQFWIENQGKSMTILKSVFGFMQPRDVQKLDQLTTALLDQLES